MVVWPNSQRRRNTYGRSRSHHALQTEVHFSSVLYQIQNKEILEIIIPANKDVLTLAPERTGVHVAYLRYRDANYIAGKYMSGFGKSQNKAKMHLKFRIS